MLKQLYIKNFTLIDTLDIEFTNGFSVITGETGAGKSIILGAIGLLLGQRADSKAIKSGCNKCIIEAHFNLTGYSLDNDFKVLFNENNIDYDASDCIIRRELTSVGKSRAFINDTPVALSLLKELGDKLIDVHSQHQNLLLNKQDFQLEVVDMMASNSSELTEYKMCYEEYNNALKKYINAQEEIERNNSNADYLRYQYNELANANLIAGEQIDLERRSDTISHFEEIKSALYAADNIFNADEMGVTHNLHSALNTVENISDVLPAAKELTERINSAYVEIKDIAQEINTLLDNIDFDSNELTRINDRLDTLYSLEKKYHCDDVNALIDMRDALKEQIDNIDNSDELLNTLKAKVESTRKKCQSLADVLTTRREKSARKVESEITSRLIHLGMSNVRFQIALEKTELGHKGQDNVTFLFSANTNTSLQPISLIASGGEIARVMLALKAMTSSAVKLPTIIFDEIDTGVSGKIAEKMAQIMQEMGSHNRQVISITHLPQIAAMGSTHYKVSKHESNNGTISEMVMLDTDGRIKEIAQMLSGSDITEAAINNAKELLHL